LYQPHQTANAPANLPPPGKIAPEFEGSELNVGGRTVSAALAEAAGARPASMGALYTKHGDLGDVALVGCCCCC
jgi:hypothetical protein